MKRRIEVELLIRMADEAMQPYTGTAMSIIRTCKTTKEVETWVNALLTKDHAFARYFKQRLILEKLTS